MANADTTAPHADVQNLESTLRSRLGSRIRDLRIAALDGGVILRGRCATYYVKQLAQQTVMTETAYLVLANEIEVS